MKPDAQQILLTRIPHPLSCTWMDLIPPSLTVMVIAVAPASTLFSKSSLTAFAGRCDDLYRGNAIEEGMLLSWNDFKEFLKQKERAKMGVHHNGPAPLHQQQCDSPQPPLSVGSPVVR